MTNRRAPAAEWRDPEGQPRAGVSTEDAPALRRLAAGYRVGRYELLCPSEPGRHSVWVARLRGAHCFEKLVAIKMVGAVGTSDPTAEALFLGEAQVIAGIRHHNVTEILDLGSADGMLFRVMEWIEGDSLELLQRAAAQQQQPIPTAVALRIVAEACAGLHAVHELSDRNGKPLGFVHRDLSPHNVLLSAAGEVKLIGFGVPKSVDPQTGQTLTVARKGKIAFISPEQALGTKVDRRSDVWAAGVVLYSLLAGRLPFAGRDQLETLRLIGQKARAADIPGLPPGLNELLHRVLEPDVEKRVPSAAALEDELERLRRNLGAATTREVGEVASRYLAPRIAARRQMIDAAILLADERAHSKAPPKPVASQQAVARSGGAATEARREAQPLARADRKRSGKLKP